jgi:hypothetical protein
MEFHYKPEFDSYFAVRLKRKIKILGTFSKVYRDKS